MSGEGSKATNMATTDANGLPRANTDLFPISGSFEPEISGLADNEGVQRYFNKLEKRANALKCRYTRAGQASVWLIGTSASYAIIRLLFPAIGFPAVVDLFAALFGVVGLLIDFTSRKRDTKKKWLINRFGAERVRSLKFQLYALATEASGEQQLSDLVASRTSAALANLEQELALGRGALEDFDPVRSIHIPLDDRAGHSVVSGPIFDAAVDSYFRHRVDYQRRFAVSEGARITQNQRAYHSLADFLFVGGAAATLIGVALSAFTLGLPPIVRELIPALGVLALVWSAVINTLQVSSMYSVNQSRFVQYARDLARFDRATVKTADDFRRLILEVETIVLRELDDFWRDTWVVSYRM